MREAVLCRPDVVRDIYVTVDGDEPDSPISFVAAAKIAGQALNTGIYVHKITTQVMARISTDAQGIVAVGDLGAMVSSDSGVGAGVGETTGDAADRWAAADGGADENGSVVHNDATHNDATHNNATHGDADARGASGMIAAFWQVRDPGNAGTVIRVADAAGCRAVVFVDDCVDMFNPKVIRATAGSLFHLPVLTMRTDEFFDWAKNGDRPVIAADVHGTERRRPEALPDVLAAWSQPEGGEREPSPVVLFGNEARGLADDVLARVGRIVSIPIYGRAESLNLATSASAMLMSMAMAAHRARRHAA